jgi:hypothetical protein
MGLWKHLLAPSVITEGLIGQVTEANSGIDLIERHCGNSILLP